MRELALALCELFYLMIWIFILFALLAFCLYFYLKYFKIPKLKSIVFVDGSLGTGKTFFSVSLAVKKYKANLRKYKIKKGILKVLSFSQKYQDRLNKLEEPLLYSNIKLRNIPFVVVTKDLLTRNNFRFAKSSVLLLDEFSLVADQMLFKNQNINNQLSEFFKLFRHEVGKDCLIVVNSQSTSDLHYSVKYVLSDYFYIHSKSRIPFFSILKTQEVFYSADKNSNVSNVTEGDIENSLKMRIVSNKFFKRYDSYCYSIFTDSLPVYKHVIKLGKDDSLKADFLVSFKDVQGLYRSMKKEEEKNENNNQEN